MNQRLSKIPGILLAGLLYSFGTIAQNYECIKPGEKHNFINGNGYLRGIRIDSFTTSGADTIYYPFKTYRGPVSNSASWVGSKCIKKPDGTFLFDNTYHDTIVIRSQANVGDHWVFYNDTDTRYFVATVTGIDTGRVLGILDSIKTIGITAFNATGSISRDTLSYFELKISKYHGWQQLFDLYNFPYRIPPGSTSSYGDIFLCILTSPPFTSFPSGHPVSRFNSIFKRETIHDPTRMELYDFAPGDAFSYGNTDALYPNYSTSGDQYYDSIMSKIIVDPYHVKYVVDRAHSYSISYASGSHTSWYARGIDTIFADTSIVSIYPQTMPEELLTSVPVNTVYYYNPFDTTFCTIGTLFGRDVPVMFEGCDDRNVYKSGFEQIREDYYSDPFPGGQDIGCHGTYTMSMWSSIKNGTQCGSRIVPNNVTDVEVSSKYEIYPDPATNNITLSGVCNINSIAIYDIVGHKKYAAMCTDKKVTIDISDLSPGIFLIVINGMHIGKFLKN